LTRSGDLLTVAFTGTDFRRRALDLFRLAKGTERRERKMRLFALAQAWLNLADHEQRVRQLEAETERLLNAEAPHTRNEPSDWPS
jgi:hypothetical protein